MEKHVRNVDIVELQRVYGLMAEVVRLEERRAWQRDRLQNITSHLSGMPGGGGVPHGLDDTFAKISEIEENHKNAVKRYTRQIKRAERIINGIENANMRAFVVMLYMDNVPEKEIREQLNFSRWGFERAKKCIEEAPNMAQVVWHERYILEK